MKRLVVGVLCCCGASLLIANHYSASNAQEAGPTAVDRNQSSPDQPVTGKDQTVPEDDVLSGDDIARPAALNGPDEPDLPTGVSSDPTANAAVIVYSLKHRNAENFAEDIRKLMPDLVITHDSPTNSVSVHNASPQMHSLIVDLIKHADVAPRDAPLGMVKLTRSPPSTATGSGTGYISMMDPSIGMPSQDVAARLKEARQVYQKAEVRVQEIATFLRNPPRRSDDSPNEQLGMIRLVDRAALRTAVANAFQARQHLLQLEIADFQARLNALSKRFAARNQAADEVIDRRVQELLNPNLRWNDDSVPPAVGEDKVSTGIPLEQQPGEFSLELRGGDAIGEDGPPTASLRDQPGVTTRAAAQQIDRRTQGKHAESSRRPNPGDAGSGAVNWQQPPINPFGSGIPKGAAERAAHVEILRGRLAQAQELLGIATERLTQLKEEHSLSPSGRLAAIQEARANAINYKTACNAIETILRLYREVGGAEPVEDPGTVGKAK